MENEEIPKDTNQESQIVESLIDCNDNMESEIEAINGNILNEANTIIDNINKNESDLRVVNNKRLELDGIQRDLDDLMFRLTTFIADSSEECGGSDFGYEEDSTETDTINSEKQDGPPEKELANINPTDDIISQFYTSGSLNPPEINWNAVGPILQKHVGDLQRLHNLNQMTNRVVKRIRNVTQISEALLTEAKKDAIWNKTETQE